MEPRSASRLRGGAQGAGNVLPLYGPLEPDATFATKEILHPPESIGDDTGQPVPGYTISNNETLKLSTLQILVYLRGAQVADPELSSALIAFRRAANVLARAEDTIIFHGQAGPNQGPPEPPGAKGVPVPIEIPPPWRVNGGQESPGLLGTAGQQDGTPGLEPRAPKPAPIKGGNALVSAVSEAIGNLESRFHLGPFACILDQKYFNIAQTAPDSSLVLPQDRILPFLGGGSLLRSSVLPDDTGLVIALGGAPIDLVVASDISVNSVQLTPHPWYVFRVHEKIVLRVNQPGAVIALAPSYGDEKGKGKGKA